MNTADLLSRLEAEGITVSLNLKLDAAAQPSTETLDLIRDNRTSLLTHLAKARAFPGLGGDAAMFAKVLEIFPPTGLAELTLTENEKASDA